MDQPWIGEARPRALSAADFETAAARLQCEAAAIRAVWEVEAAGQHFLPDGGVVRRFEPHHFPRSHWSALGFAPRPGEAPWRAALRLSDEAMFRAAAALDTEAACRATSWGAPQIMGFNHRDAGFDTAAAMVAHMARGAPQQLGAFVQLIEGWGLAPALRAHDWAAFARRYNGTGQIETYARRMEAAWRRHADGVASPVVLRVGDRGASVMRLQAALGIPEDGAFGPETLSAVRAFQTAQGLSVDGIVGAQTWAALARASADVVPEVQETPADALLGRIRDWSAVGGAVAATVATLAQALPPTAMTILVAGAVGCGGIAMLALALRWARP
ncbi:MAG: N-acetylmuramidase domain-containing protein [Alkalilacustris sp.]